MRAKIKRISLFICISLFSAVIASNVFAEDSTYHPSCSGTKYWAHIKYGDVSLSFQGPAMEIGGQVNGAFTFGQVRDGGVLKTFYDGVARNAGSSVPLFINATSGSPVSGNSGDSIPISSSLNR